MATTRDNLQWIMEENPRHEGAPNSGDTQLSTNITYLPIQTARADPAVQFVDRSDEVRGLEGAVASIIETYEPAGNLTMRSYANPLTSILACAGLQYVVTPGDGIILDPAGVAVPDTAYRWVFTKRLGIVAKTAQVTLMYADELTFLRMQGTGVSQLTIDSAGQVGADLMGLVFGRIADPNVTPSLDSLAIPHFRRGDLSVTPWLTGSGTTDDFSITLTNPLVRRRSMGLSPPSYFADKLEHADERVQLRGTIPKSALDPDDIDALLAGTTFAGTAKWVSPKSIAALADAPQNKYRMFIEMPALQYTGGQADELANRRRFGANFDWFATWDETAGYDFKITLINAVAAIESGYT